MEVLFLIAIAIGAYFFFRANTGAKARVVTDTASGTKVVAIPRNANVTPHVSDIESAVWAKLVEEHSLTTAQKATFDNVVRDLSAPLSLVGEVNDVDGNGTLWLTGEMRVFKPELKSDYFNGVVTAEWAAQGLFPNGEFSEYRKGQAVKLSATIISARVRFDSENHIFAFALENCEFDDHPHLEQVTLLRFMEAREIRDTYLSAAVNHHLFLPGMAEHTSQGN